MGETAITDKMRNTLGKETTALIIEVEKGMLRKLADAIEDPNPLWQDEKYARKTRYGGIIAPPNFVGITKYPELIIDNIVMDYPYQGVLNGGTEIEYYLPIRVGDIITRKDKLAKLFEKEGKLGRMIFEVWERTFWNQFGEQVALVRQTSIVY